MNETDQIAGAGDARAAWQLLAGMIALLINRQTLPQEEVAQMLDDALRVLEQGRHHAANQAVNDHARTRMQELLQALTF